MTTYDPAFRRDLGDAIMLTIGRESCVADGPPRLIAIRPVATRDAVTDVLISVLAISSDMDDPTELSRTVEAIAHRLRTETARARAEGLYARIIGAARGGKA